MIFTSSPCVMICDRLQENRAQRSPDEKFFFCTYRLLGKQILSSPSFIAVALAIPAIYRLTVPFVAASTHAALCPIFP